MSEDSWTLEFERNWPEGKFVTRYGSAEVERLKDAASAVYKAAWWKSSTLDAETEKALWVELRDALGIPAGESTAALGAMDTNP